MLSALNIINPMASKSYIAFILLLICLDCTSQAIIDGLQTDWEIGTVIVNDEGDVSSNQMDILTLNMTDDTDFLYFRLETDREWNLDEQQDLTLYLDSDNNPGTGLSIQGIGAELTYFFAERYGLSELDGSVNHDDLDLYIAPTTSSNWYEFALSKNSPGLDLRQSQVIRCYIDNGSNSSDHIGPIEYTMQNNQRTELEYSFDKVSAADFRIVSYNVKFDGWFESETQDDQRQIIQALNPDIIAFQEIYDHSSQEIEQSLDQILPSPTGWNTIHHWSDVHLFTTHDVIGTDAIDGNEISLLQVNGEPLIVVNVHFPCCDKDQERQEEVDRLLSVLRDRNTNGTLSFDFDQDTPLIITGDYNLVGDSQQYISLLTGDILFNSTFGSDASLDSDGSGLSDANLLHPHLPSNHTWYNPFSSFAPGKLDLFLYSDTSLNLENGYVMNTAGLSDALLQEHNLSHQSTTRASDHLPIVADFKFNTTVSVDPVVSEQIKVIPSPVTDLMTIDLDAFTQVESVTVIDLHGRHLIHRTHPHPQDVNIDVSHLQDGYYLIRVITKQRWITQPFIIQR